MKSSLGRRSSARSIPRSLTFTELESAKKDKRSGIPVRSQSSDRYKQNVSVMMPMGNRTQSSDRISMSSTCADRMSAFGTERPSRGTTVSTSSNRLSSFGGTRLKKDNRPIQDKNWQIMTQRKIEDFLRNDPEGCHLENTIRPISLKLFINIVNILLGRLEGDCKAVFIHKDNYITELPYIMKKMLYRGKMEKSWLISVNTAQSWPHVLACLDFLVSCVKSQQVIDPMKLMFPEIYCKEEEDIWNYKLLLPYFHKSYELFLSNSPDYPERQAALDSEMIEMQMSGEDVYHTISQMEEELARVRKEYDCKKNQRSVMFETVQVLKAKYHDLREQLMNQKKSSVEMNQEIDDLLKQMKKLSRDHENQLEYLERKQQSKLELQEFIANQKISRKGVEVMREKRASLQREIESQQAYLNEYEEVVFKNSLEVLNLKHKIKDFLKNFNIELLKYPVPALDEATLINTLDEEAVDRAVAICNTLICEAKEKLVSCSSSRPNVPKAMEEVVSLENECQEKQLNYNMKLKKYEKTKFEAKEKIEKLKSELKEVEVKLEECSGVLEEKLKLEADQKSLQQREAEFRMLKDNARLYATYCMEIREKYAKKYKDLLEEYRREE